MLLDCSCLVLSFVLGFLYCVIYSELGVDVFIPSDALGKVPVSDVLWCSGGPAGAVCSRSPSIPLPAAAELARQLFKLTVVKQMKS